MLRQRRTPGHPTEEEISGNHAATIMTSVSSFNLTHLFILTVYLEHDKAKFGAIAKQAGLDETR